jgi:hypothetical protein
VRTLIPSASGVGHDDGTGQHEQRLREAAEPLPLTPGERLQPQPLAPARDDVALLGRAPLHDDVAGQADVEGEERTGDAADQRPAAEQPGPPDLPEPHRRQRVAGHQDQGREAGQHQGELGADGVAEAQPHPAGRHGHHQQESRDPQQPEEVAQGVRQPGPFRPLLGGGEGHGRRGRQPGAGGPAEHLAT